MNIALTPQLEKLVEEKVRSGMYESPSEVVREGLRLLRERDSHLEALRLDVGIGFNQIANGEYCEFDRTNLKNLVAGVKARGRKRLAAEGQTDRKR